jgi:hypothetical protein
MEKVTMAKLSGGGITSNKLVHPNVRTGPASSNKMDPRGVSQFGYSPGSTLDRSGSFTTKNSALPVNAGTMTQVPSGNQVALNVGQGGPGAGCTVYRTGTQQMHGAPVRGNAPQGRDIFAQFPPETTSRGSLVKGQ